MLALAIVARSLPLYYLPVAVLVMIPINLLVFALENLIYLLYPYRVNQEGLEIFLRTMLTFTAKGLLFVAALEAMSAWGFAAARLTHAASQWSGRAINGYAVFTAGMIVGPAVLAAVVLVRWAAPIAGSTRWKTCRDSRACRRRNCWLPTLLDRQRRVDVADGLSHVASRPGVLGGADVLQCGLQQLLSLAQLRVGRGLRLAVATLGRAHGLGRGGTRLQGAAGPLWPSSTSAL